MNRVASFFGDNIANMMVLEAMLLATYIVGDSCLIFVTYRMSDYMWLRAAVDSSTHGFIALWSWAVVENANFDRYKILNCLICALIAIGVDLDHFFAAKSLNIKDAISLPSRPPFHLTTIIPVVSGTLWILGTILKSKSLKTLSLIFFTAVFSHHLRDATRRGFWLAPFKNTRAVPYWMYTGVTLLLPFFVRLIFISYRLDTQRLKTEKEFEVVIQ